MSPTELAQLRNHNNENDVLMSVPEAANGQRPTIDGLIDVNEYYKDDPSLSEDALTIIVISVCCFIAIVIIFIIIVFCYTRRPSAYEIHSSNSIQFTARESCPFRNPLVRLPTKFRFDLEINKTIIREVLLFIIIIFFL